MSSRTVPAQIDSEFANALRRGRRVLLDFERDAKGDRGKQDVIALVDGLFLELFALVSDVGSVVVTYVDDPGIRFVMGGTEVFVWRVPIANSLLRMFCARLGVICQQLTGKNESIYGAEYELPHGSAGIVTSPVDFSKGSTSPCKVVIENVPGRVRIEMISMPASSD